MSLGRRLLAEGIGSLLLAAAVIGSGIMAERLSAGNGAVALIANTGATIAVLATLIAMLGPVSGAHFNPAVSLIQTIRGELSIRDVLVYVSVQILGCAAGALLAHAMFELPLLQASTHIRAGPAQWLSESVATCGLILVVLSSANAQIAAWRVAAWIGAAYWFTASTSFANPAITIARHHRYVCGHSARRHSGLHRCAVGRRLRRAVPRTGSVWCSQVGYMTCFPTDGPVRLHARDHDLRPQRRGWFRSRGEWMRNWTRRVCVTWNRPCWMVAESQVNWLAIRCLCSICHPVRQGWNRDVIGQPSPRYDSQIACGSR